MSCAPAKADLLSKQLLTRISASSLVPGRSMRRPPISSRSRGKPVTAPSVKNCKAGQCGRQGQNACERLHDEVPSTKRKRRFNRHDLRRRQRPSAAESGGTVRFEVMRGQVYDTHMAARGLIAVAAVLIGLATGGSVFAEA